MASVPAMGVHNPNISRVPAPTAADCRIVTCRSGPVRRTTTPSKTSRIPVTSLIKSRAAPGHPLGNMEKRRCRGVNPVSGCDCHTQEAAILEAVGIEERLTNGYKPTNIVGQLRQPTAQEGLV